MGRTFLRYWAPAIAAVFALPGTASAVLVLQVRAVDYNATTGAVTTPFGPDLTQTDSTRRPALITNATSNGSSAMRFDGGDVLVTDTVVTSGTNDYTFFAYLRGNAGSSAATIVSGVAGSPQYRLGGDGAANNDKQQLIRRSQANLGTANTALNSATFNNINVATGGSSSTFRLNLAADGTLSSTTAYTQGVQFIGSGANPPGESFSGDIVEVRVYDTILTLGERQTVEAELNTSYGFVPEPGTLSALGAAAALSFVRRRRGR